MHNIAGKIQDREIAELSKLCRRQAEYENEVQIAEERLKEYKQRLRNISELEIPEKMMALGVSQLRLADGTVISIDTFYSASITEAHRTEALSWLEDNGYSALIKSEIKVATKKGERDIAERTLELLRQANIPYTNKDSVHPQTLKAFVREQIESGQTIPMDLLSVHIGNRAKITKK